MPVFDVPLVSVIGQQHENWALRMMAHGRHVSWENFRSRQESVFAGILLRLIRGDLVSPDGRDFVTIMNAEHKKRHPQKELHDWEARYDTWKHVAEELAVEFRKRVRSGQMQPCSVEFRNWRSRSQHLSDRPPHLRLQAGGSPRNRALVHPKGSTKRRLPFHEPTEEQEHDPLHGLMEAENPDDVLMYPRSL